VWHWNLNPLLCATPSYHEAILLFGGMKTAGDWGSLLTFA
jgi:hypothetical protein